MTEIEGRRAVGEAFQAKPAEEGAAGQPAPPHDVDYEFFSCEDEVHQFLDAIWEEMVIELDSAEQQAGVPHPLSSGR